MGVAGGAGEVEGGLLLIAFYTHTTNCVYGWVGPIMFSRCPFVCSSVMLSFLNIFQESLTEFHQTLHTHSYTGQIRKIKSKG